MSLDALDRGALQQAWTTFQSSISDEESKHFETLACDGLDEYIATLVSACKAHRDTHLRIRILEWFEPIYQVVQRLVPVAAIAIQAYPTPGSLVLGSIVGVLQIAERLYEYQARTMQFLTQISSKLQTLLAYENDLYEDNEFVSRALVLVFGDILTFCNRAFKFMTHKGSLHARVKGFRWMTFKDFEKQLGEVVTGFDLHMGELEARALECDKQRLKEIRAMLEVYQNESKQAKDSQNQKTSRLEELSEQIMKKQTELDDRRNTKEKEKQRARALNWLSPLTFTDAYLRIMEKHLEGTGTWLLESPTYQSWKCDEGPKILWVRGKPGCGKSFLAARVNLDLSLAIKSGISVAYAFFQRADQNMQTQQATLGALAKQLIVQKQKSEPMLDKEYSSEYRSETASEKLTWQILEHVIADSTVTTYIVVDALDECKDGGEFARCLARIANHFRNTKIIVFSRDDIQFEEIFTGCARLRPDYGENERDLRAYLDAVFDNPEDTIPLSHDIRNQCVEKAQGVILWVRLFRESLRHPVLRHKRLKKIGEMQPGLEAIYDDLLLTLGLGEQYVKEQAWLILLLILHARRPMTAAEMLEAVALLEDVHDLTALREESYPNGDYLTSICANLIFIDREGVVRLFHESVRNHLESQGTARGASWVAEYKSFCHDAHQKCAEICLKYLMLQDFDYGGARSLAQLSIRLKKAPFLKYATTSWAWHYKQANSSSGLLEHLHRLIESAPRRELCLQFRLYDIDVIEPRELPFCLGTTNALQLLAVEGLHSEAEILLDNVARLSEQGTVFGIHVLSWCSILGHQEMSLWLLSLNSSLDIKDKEAALTNAIGNGHVDIARHLIDHDVDIHIKDARGEGLLILAARNNHTAVVSLLLSKSMGTTSYSKAGWTALHYAANASNTEMVEALCKAGADPAENKRSQFGQTPLHIAAMKDAAVSIKAMSDHDTQLNINATDSSGSTILHYAARFDASNAMSVLVELGCHIDITNSHGETALFLAAERGYVKTVQLLISKGADICLPTNLGRTALLAAAYSGKPNFLQTVIQHKPATEWAELLNLAENDGRTVVHAAVTGGDVENLKFAISAGGDGSTKTNLGSSPLHFAALYGNKDMIQLILKASLNPNSRNKRGDTPLHSAAEDNNVEFMQKLFQECDEEGVQIDIDALDNWGYSPLMWALVRGQLQAAELLLEKGAASIADKNGSYPIHVAAENGHVKLVEILLNHPGVDCKGFEDRLALHCAAMSGKVAIIQLFKDQFTQQLNVQDKSGRTPVILALEYEHIEATNYLLDHHADLTPVDCYGENIIHHIVRYGDLGMLRRATSMGCDGSIPNKYGETALIKAAEYSNMDLFDELLRLYPESWTVTDSLGKACQHHAASEGNLELLIRLQELGADLKKRDFCGRSPMYYGAEEGHLHVVKYLHNQGCPIDDFDDSGWTLLMSAVDNGNLAVVGYLLKYYAPGDVNQVQQYSCETAMTKAAIRGFDVLYDMVKEAGGNPFHCDAMGLSNEYYSTFVSQDELDGKAGYVLERYAHNSVQYCCKMLKHFTQISVGEFSTHLDWRITLTQGLLRRGDFDLAKLCLMERFWNPELDVIRDRYSCDICNCENFGDSIHVCKSCLSSIVFCGDCHENYVQNGRKSPSALEELRIIEEKMRAIRMVIPRDFGVEDTMRAAYYFGADAWINSMNKLYESWGLNCNANNAYDALLRPGHEFIKILSSARELKKETLITNGFSRDEARSESWSKISERFEKLKLKHPIGKLQARLRCSGHEFYMVSKTERDRLVAEGIKLDSEYGRVTDAVYEEICAKYSKGYDLEVNKETLALPELSSTSTLELEQRNEKVPSSPQIEAKAQLVESLNQLTSILDEYVIKERTAIAPIEAQILNSDEAAHEPKQEDSDPVDRSSIVKVDHPDNQSSFSQAIDPTVMQRLRETYLEFYRTAAPDDELWIWAVAIQIAEIASPGFQGDFEDERLAILAEEDYELKS